MALLRIKHSDEPKGPSRKPPKVPLWVLEIMCWEGWERRRKKKVACVQCMFWMRRNRERDDFVIKDPFAPGFCMQRGLKTGAFDYCKDRGLGY